MGAFSIIYCCGAVVYNRRLSKYIQRRTKRNEKAPHIDFLVSMTPRKTGHSMNGIDSCCTTSESGARVDDGAEEENIRNESSSAAATAAAVAVVPMEGSLESTTDTQTRNHRQNALAPFDETVDLSSGREAEESKEEITNETQQATGLQGEESKEEIVELATTQMAMIADDAEEYAAVWLPNENIEASAASVQEDDLAALKRAAYRGQSSDGGGGSLSDRLSDHVGQQGTVVAIPDASALQHSGELATEGAVHAELVGQDFSSVAAIDTQGEESTYADPLQQQTTLPVTTEQQTTEATVIDSEPLQEVDNQEADELLVWKTEEAQVVSDNSSGAGRKVAAEDEDSDNNNLFSATRNEYSNHGEARDRIDSVIADQVAEVLGIQEEVHPDEFLDNDAEAQLVGTDASAVATVFEQQRDGAEGTTFSNSIVVSDQQAFGIQENIHQNEYMDRSTDVAELVGRDYHLQDAGSAERVVNVEQIGITEPQAEVLGIHENAHPNEFTGENAAQAQFVGPGLASSVATTTLPSQDEDNITEAVVVEEAMVIGASTTPQAPAQGEAYSSPSVEKPPPSQSAADIAVLPATTAVEEELLYPQKGPPESRSVSWGNGEASAPLEEEVYSEEVDRPEWLRDTPPPQTPLGATNAEASASSTGNASASSQRLQMISSNLARSTTNVMEALFGDSSPPFLNRRGRSSTSEIAECIIPRKLLPWSVIYSPPTKMWVATLQTNQKALDKNNISEASKSLRAFSLPTEKSAVALAKAWTPPRMMTFSNYQTCHICSARFALLRRPCHCRNCGVVICKECSVPWPAKMIPDTYNFKKESIVNVCLSCNWLSNQFRLALLNGNQDQAVAVAATGNINLHAPFANVKGELFYPVHCAALGGSLALLKWLVDENCCPIKSLRVSGGGASGTYTPIVTSKGRSLLGIAMENRSVDMVRYLVVKKGISLAGEKDITFELLLRNLDKVLRLLPEDVFGVGKGDEADAASGAQEEDVDLGMVSRIYPKSFDDQESGRSLSDGARNLGATENDEQNDCIICFDSPIDCVTVPCGHQICCLKCSKHISRCPVCSMDCTFMRVFKP